MKYRYFFFFLIWALIGIQGQSIIPENRLTNFHNVGCEDFTGEVQRVVLATDYGLDSTGGSYSDLPLTDLFDQKPENELWQIVFPAGLYKFENPMQPPSNIILKGQSGAQWVFETEDNEDCILIRGTMGSPLAYLGEPAERGVDFLQVAAEASIKEGDWIKVYDVDSDLITSTWARESTGQIVQVDGIDTLSDRILLRDPLRRTFRTSRSAAIRKINPKYRVGIEGLNILRQFKTSGQTSNIEFQNSVHCYIRCINSEKTNFAHVNVVSSAHISIQQSEFQSAHGFGGGGQGYGVVLNFSTSNSEVSNNYFDSLRHSILLQAGANGNVVGYNYSTRPYWTGVFLPSDAAGDLVLHGNYPFCNLLEGNIVQNIVIDASHGINGPDHIFFRNRAELYGIFIDPFTPSDQQIFIGNEVPRSDLPYGLFSLSGEDHIVYGNLHDGEIIPPGTDTLQQSSMYLDTIPSFYTSKSAWPPIGLPQQMPNLANEVQWRHDNGLGLCREIDFTYINDEKLSRQLVLSPNPTNGSVFIDVKGDEFIPRYYELFALSGQMVQSGSISPSYRVVIRNAPKGIYYMFILSEDGRVIAKSIVLQ